MHPPTRRRARLATTVAVAALVALAAAGCATGQKTPSSYSPAVQKQFIEGCVKVGMSDGVRSARSFCTCAYAELRDGLPFSQFKKVNSELTDNGGPLPGSVSRLVERCRP